jgi:hypothetical protein
VSVYSIWGNTLPVVNTGAGIAYRLKWELNEREIALYDSEHTGGLLCLHEIILPNVTCRRHLPCQSAVICM